MTIHQNLSAMASTPELHTAISLAQNNGKSKWTFYTTIGHVVTKVMDMDITFTLPDGSSYRPFTTTDTIDDLLKITKKDYSDIPHAQSLDYLLVEGLRSKITKKDREVFISQWETMVQFFQDNVWDAVTDSDTIDTLFSHIDELAHMGIEGITRAACDDVKEWIIMQTIDSEYTLDSWKEMPEEERNQNTVGFINKEIHTENFAYTIVNIAWNKDPRSSNNAFPEIAKRVQALYRVDEQDVKDMRGVSVDQLRNTRYL